MNQEVIRYGFVLPHWVYWGVMIVFPAVFLLLTRLFDRNGAAQAAASQGVSAEWAAPGNGFTRFIDKLCRGIGVFACLWTIPCVFYYIFEVVGRYFFNSPTNWVHEAAFLMFGMMYTLGGAALYLINGHVRVDVFYSKWSARGRAAADMITFPIFSIFILGMLLAGWRFWGNGLDQNVLPSWIARGYQFDISQSEWQIAYWPVKAMIPLGALLVLLQGISRFVRDFQTFWHFSEGDDGK
jgi:TRAP-type mannitol/chloroaromatic compound transport system permease small subunit